MFGVGEDLKTTWKSVFGLFVSLFFLGFEASKISETF